MFCHSVTLRLLLAAIAELIRGCGGDDQARNLPEHPDCDFLHVVSIL
jgi:hypothetical protein